MLCVSGCYIKIFYDPLLKVHELKKLAHELFEIQDTHVKEIQQLKDAKTGTLTPTSNEMTQMLPGGDVAAAREQTAVLQVHVCFLSIPRGANYFGVSSILCCSRVRACWVCLTYLAGENTRLTYFIASSSYRPVVSVFCAFVSFFTHTNVSNHFSDGVWFTFLFFSCLAVVTLSQSKYLLPVRSSVCNFAVLPA